MLLFLNIVRKEDLICIENINKNKIWGTTNDGKVILENFEEGKDGQLWKKGEPDAEGYFTLENYKVSKFLTAASLTSLELKGNIYCIMSYTLFQNERDNIFHYFSVMKSS